MGSPIFSQVVEYFPIVLIMDNTYKTNKYKQPMFEIVGMTSTELTFSVAFDESNLYESWVDREFSLDIS